MSVESTTTVSKRSGRKKGSWLESWQRRWDRLQAEAGVTIIENILIIGAALVILLAIMAWIFPDVFERIKKMVDDLITPRSS
jgi:hypothetical protein